MPKRRRKSLSLRLQPFEGTPLAEVADYLNSLDRAEVNQRVGEILVMTLLPYARAHRGDEVSDNLRYCCLEACDAMDKHASTMRQALRVPQPQFKVGLVATATNGHSATDGESKEEANLPSPQIKGEGTAAVVDALFGD